MKIRKNLSQLSTQERQDYVRGVKLLKAETGRKTNIAGQPINTYDYFVDMHNEAMVDAHRGSAFLPWHRAYLLEFENELGRILAQPDYALPYWDWAADSALSDPTQGMVWEDNFMGGTGNPVASGPFQSSEWTIYKDNRGNPDGALYRSFSNRSGLPNQSQVDECMDIKVFDTAPWNGSSRGSFRDFLEGTLHNPVHGWVGGAMGLMTSPNDPVFFLHHCNVDRIWAEWQVKNPDQVYLPESGALNGHNRNDNMRWVNKTPEEMWDFNALGFSYDTIKLKINNRYVWLPQLRSLPAEISYDVTCNRVTDEFLPCFSFNKVRWGRGDCDALCWYLSPHRHDFTFRTNLFGTFPRVQRPMAGFNAEVGKTYKITCRISENSATYEIDGRTYATATYNEGTVPNEGYFGFAVYHPADIDIDNIVISPILEPVPA